MKIFLIKTAIIFFISLIFFKLTIGSLYNTAQKKLEETLSRDQILLIKDKVRDEMKKGLKKEKILDEQDAELIKQFIKKVLSEIN